jgi:hypothetical protein
MFRLSHFGAKKQRRTLQKYSDKLGAKKFNAPAGAIFSAPIFRRAAA